jgi:hypothetical protein
MMPPPSRRGVGQPLAAAAVGLAHGLSLTEETEAVVKKSLPKGAIVVPSRPPNQIINPPDKVSGFPQRT